MNNNYIFKLTLWTMVSCSALFNNAMVLKKIINDPGSQTNPAYLIKTIAQYHAMMDFHLELYKADNVCSKNIPTTDVPVDTDTVEALSKFVELPEYTEHIDFSTQSANPANHFDITWPKKINPIKTTKLSIELGLMPAHVILDYYQQTNQPSAITTAHENNTVLQYQQSLPSTNRKINTCATCSRNFTSQSILKMHKKTHNRKKPYTYKYCDASPRSSVLNARIKRHTTKQPYTFNLCDETFSQSTNRNTHQKPYILPNRKQK